MRKPERVWCNLIIRNHHRDITREMTNRVWKIQSHKTWTEVLSIGCKESLGKAVAGL